MRALASVFIAALIVFCILCIVIFFIEPITELLNAKAEELRAKAEKIRKENDNDTD